MTNSKYRYLVPNGITFLSLTCGMVSILLSATGRLWEAGLFILASYILDLFDGAAARGLKAGSEFGLQLDSLVDMVSLGTAPAVLLFMHLRAEGLADSFLIWSVILVPLAGAFRLARFNLLPPKKSSNSDSMGLTISTGGATCTLAVLSDLALSPETYTNYLFIALIVFISLLMVSTIAFPSPITIVPRRRSSLLLLLLLGISVWFLSFIHAWFLWTNAYLGLSLARAGYRSFK